MLDQNGKRPEIYICTSNRSAGKTTYFGRMVVNRFKNKNKKFGLIYRYNYELDECADKFFKDISTLFFDGAVMTSKRRASGIYHELYINDEHCGYALSLNSADQLKKYAHLLSDIDSLIFDEFQSESNKYCNKEVQKLLSIHTSIARGQGKQVRYVPVYMISNPVSMINPYYIEMGIATRLTKDTKFLRGDGFVLEQGFNESASIAQETSAFNRAFSQNKYSAYASQAIYLNDNQAFVAKPDGRGRYIATLKYNGMNFSVKEYNELGIVYCDDSADLTFPYKIVVTTDDHEINYVMLRNSDTFIQTMRYYFDRGCFRFKDLRCKEAILTALSY